MQVTTHKILNRSERELLESRLMQGFGAWLGRYSARPVALRCELETPADPAAAQPSEAPAPDSWRVCERGGAPLLALGLPGNWLAAVAALVLPLPQVPDLEDPRGLMPALAEELLRELAAGVLQELCPGPSGTGGWRWLTQPGPPGQGAVRAACHCGGELTLYLELPLATVLTCVAGLAPPRPAALTGRRLAEALQGEPVSLEVVVGEVELAIAELSGVRVGDVIKLERSLEASLDLKVRGGPVVCGVRLGTHQGRAALQLTGPAAPRPR